MLLEQPRFGDAGLGMLEMVQARGIGMLLFTSQPQKFTAPSLFSSQPHLWRVVSLIYKPAFL